MNVTITDEMLDAAVKKAVEAGLLPRDACRADTLGYQELIRYVVTAALEVAPASTPACLLAAAKHRNGMQMRFYETRGAPVS